MESLFFVKRDMVPFRVTFFSSYYSYSFCKIISITGGINYDNKYEWL